MSPRTILRNALSAAGQTIVRSVVFLVVYRYVLGTLGIEAVGLWSVVLATASSARVSEFGLGASVTRFVAARRAQHDLVGARTCLQTGALTVGVLLAVALVVAYPALAWLLPRILPPAAEQDGLALLPYALASVWFNAVAGVWQGGLDGCLRSDLRAGLAIASSFVFMTVVFIAAPSMGLLGLAVAQLVEAVLLATAGWLAVRTVLRGAPWLPIEWNRASLAEMLRYGVKVQAMAVVMLLFDPIAKVWFVRFGGLSAAGYFELAEQLVMRVRAVIVEGNRVLVPVVAGMRELGHDVRALYVRNATLLVVVLTPVFALVACLIPAAGELWLGGREEMFVAMGVILTAAWFFNSLSAPAYFAFLGAGDLRWLFVGHAVLGLGNLAGGAALGPPFGWMGVLAAFSMSLAVGSLVPVYRYHREHGVRLRDVTTRADAPLILGCLAVALFALAGDAALAGRGWSAWGRLCVPASAAVLIGLLMWKNPVIRTAGRRLSLTSGRSDVR